MLCLRTQPAPDARARRRSHRTLRAAVSGLLLTMSLCPSQSPATERGADKNGHATSGPSSVASLPGVPGVTVDWQRGVLEASASAAADLYAASVDVARLKAERLARARAEERLRRALAALRSDARLSARLGTASVAGLDVRSAQVRFIDYGSNGSVVLRLSLPLTAPPAAAAKPAGPASGSTVPDAGSPQDAAPSTDRPEN
jgi:hypothetical protein